MLPNRAKHHILLFTEKLCTLALSLYHFVFLNYLQSILNLLFVRQIEKPQMVSMERAVLLKLLANPNKGQNYFL